MFYAGSPEQLDRKAGSSRDVVYFDIRKQGRQRGSRLGPCRFRQHWEAIYQGVIAYPSLTGPAIEGFGRGALEELNRRRFDQSIDGGDFTQALVGGSDDELVERSCRWPARCRSTAKAESSCPRLAEHAGITDRATFVGRGARFQIWSPKEHSKQQLAEVAALRAKLNGGDVP